MSKKKEMSGRYRSPENWDTFDLAKTWKLRIIAMGMKKDVTHATIVNRVNKKGVWLDKPYFSRLVNLKHVPDDKLRDAIEAALVFYERKVK